MGDLRRLIRKVLESIENFQTGHKRSGASAVDAASVVADLFDRAEYYLYLVLCPAEKQNIYQDPRVITALRYAVVRGVTVRILVGPSGDSKAISQSLDPRRSRKLEVRMLADEGNIHFAVIDRRHVRLEQDTHPVNGTPVVDVIVVYDFDRNLSKREPRFVRFEKMWEQATA